MISENLAATLAASTTPSNFAFPSQYCCDIYNDPNFTGLKHTVCASATTEKYEYVPSEFVNRNSSWACGKNVQYWFCDGAFPCEGNRGESGAGKSSNNKSGISNRIN